MNERCLFWLHSVLSNGEALVDGALHHMAALSLGEHGPAAASRCPDTLAAELEVNYSDVPADEYAGAAEDAAGGISSVDDSAHGPTLYTCLPLVLDKESVSDDDAIACAVANLARLGAADKSVPVPADDGLAGGADD
jgi:hypothetical protein